MKKFEVSSIYSNEITIDPCFIDEGIEYALTNNLWCVKILPLNAFSEYGFTSTKELYNFYLDTERFKRHNTFFKELSITDYVKIQGNKICDLYELSNLKSLFFIDNSFKIDFSRLPKLEILRFKYNRRVSNLGVLKNLLELLIISLSEVNLKLLNGLDNLEILRLTRGDFTSLSGIENLKRLRRIDLAYVSKLRDVEQITTLPNLKKLHIEKCKLLDNFSFLSGNESIEELFIDNLESLDFILSLKNLKKINFWYCKNGDMTPLLKSKSLEQVNFYPNKKKYSHTIEEIIEITGLKRGVKV
jgi:internalin A